MKVHSAGHWVGQLCRAQHAAAGLPREERLEGPLAVLPGPHLVCAQPQSRVDRQSPHQFLQQPLNPEGRPDCARDPTGLSTCRLTKPACVLATPLTYCTGLNQS
jgi:hypothetical protein